MEIAKVIGLPLGATVSTSPIINVCYSNDAT